MDYFVSCLFEYIRIKVFWDRTSKTFDLDKIVNADNYLKL